MMMTTTTKSENPAFSLPDINGAGHHGNGYNSGMFGYNGNHGNDVPESGLSATDRYLPRIVVRDVTGRKLDTQTSYQRAIYEAKRKFSQGEYPFYSEEWRLPHAPLPARPDFSRTAPPLALQRQYKEELKKINKTNQSQPEFSETIDSDRDFQNLRWSLQQAETLPPLAGARLINLNSSRVPPKTYLPFVGAAPTTTKTYLETDIREREYEFPGYCSGCIKGTGLCYGCEKDSNPHYHKDKIARTGGGFVYLKHDKAYGTIDSKNPANWNVAIPESERRQLYIQMGKLPYPEHPELLGRPQWLPDKPKLLPPTAYVFYDDVIHPDFKKYGHKVSVVRLRDGDQEAFVDEVGIPYDPEHPSSASRIATYVTDTGFDEASTDRRTTTDMPRVEEESKTTVSVDTGRQPDPISFDQYLSTLTEYSTLVKESSETSKETREKTETTTESGISARSKEPSLYKAPPPFKLKSSEKRVTVAKDPFSKDRHFDIPTGSGLEIKKSDKALTDFDEFRFGEGNWQDPKFEGHARSEVAPKEKSRPEMKVSNDRKSASDVTIREEAPKPTAPTPPPTATDIKQVVLEEKKEDKEFDVIKEVPRSKTPDSVTPETKPEALVSESTLTEPEVAEKQEGTPPPQEIAENTPPSSITDIPETDTDSTSSSTKRVKKPRAPIVKKERKQREPPVRRSRRDAAKDVIEEEPEVVVEKPSTPRPEAEKEPAADSEPEPEPEVATLEFKEPSLPTPPPMRKIPPPPLPRAAPPIPPLPREYTDIEKPKREVSQTLIEAPPPMYEPPKQRRPPPVKRPKAKNRERRLPLIRPAEVPKEQPDVKRIMDPLDYLAKYCIIHKDRLPHYERVFNKVIKEQQYRYADVPHDAESWRYDVISGNEIEDTPGDHPMKTRLTTHEEQMINDFILINRSTQEQYAMVGYNVGDQNVQKVNFTLDTLINKYEELQEKHDKLQADRILMIAQFAKKMFPEVLQPNFKGDGKKKKKKKKSKKHSDDEKNTSASGNTADVSVQTETETRITEVDIVRRLTGKMLEEISQLPDIAHINLEIERLQEKLRDVDDRIEDLEDEKKLLQLYSRDLYLKDICQKKRELTFLRKQSALYQKMHPSEDPEMNLSELEDALQQINGHLISEKELQFIYHILDLKSRRRINLQLFCVVAALSEKVKQVDPFIRKLINKFNYDALNVKMDKSKELFWLLDEESDEVPSGKITANSLAVELAAGGVSPEHTQFVVNKFNRECKGTVDFLDYLTYVPLFIELHGRIIEDPLSSKRVF